MKKIGPQIVGLLERKCSAARDSRTSNPNQSFGTEKDSLLAKFRR